MPGSVTVVVVDGGRRPAAALSAAGLTLLGRTGDPEEAARLVADTQPQVALVDLLGGLPGGVSAATVVEAIVARAPDTPVLVASGSDDHAAVLSAVRAGAAGYLVGPTGLTELAAAARRTAAGETVFSPGLAEVVLAAHGRGARAPVRLTERESDVLRLVVEGLTARQIAKRLVLSPRTVENHVRHVQLKLGVPNRAALVRFAIENGLA